MNTRVLQAVSGRLSLRKPQKESLEALAKAIEASDKQMLNPKRELAALLDALKAEFPTLADFERDFPSLCFALATGVGKTRLMGAFISYLYLAHGIKNFFVLAPNLTIYEKLIADFTPGNPKYVFKGIAEFATNAPRIITGDDYDQQNITGSQLFSSVDINIFNISKINSEVRGGKAPRIKRLKETIGDSYFNYLASLPDLVMLMDESHRYRGGAGVRSLNELNPLFALELTATPFIESTRGPVPFKNVVVDYPLARAMDDGFVKEPAVVTQRNFDAKQYDQQTLERIKLQDGIRLHEKTKVDLMTYARENDVKLVKPIMLVIARDTTHAAQLLDVMENLFEGRYQGKILQVDSSKKEEEVISRLLQVESVDEPTEIVIHVNMLKEGWDVTNLYTIVPLRAANARTLIEQSIGRGLRLPYGKRTGEQAVDRLSIVAHDKFQEIVDAANDPKNPLRLERLILDAPDDDPETESVSVKPNLDNLITGIQTTGSKGTDYSNQTSSEATKPTFNSAEEQQLAQKALKAIESLKNNPTLVPTTKALTCSSVQKQIIETVQKELTEQQQSLLKEQERVDVEEVVKKTVELVMKHTIDIPRIAIVPQGDVTYGYRPFELDISRINLQPQERTMISQSLQNSQQIEIGEGDSGNYEPISENYIVKKLFNYDDISYDEHAEILFRLASQAVQHLQSYLKDEKDVENVLQNQAEVIAREIHAQMNDHYYEEATSYDVEVRSGFTPLKECAYTAAAGQKVRSYRETVTDKGKIKQMLFGKFNKSLYPIQKFDSDTERRFAVIIERDCEKWFKPAKGQFQIFYKNGVDEKNYVPDFVVEIQDSVLMVETKSRKDMDDPIVKVKAEVATTWCKNASNHLLKNGGKAWKYLLIPHDEVLEHNNLATFIQKFEIK